MLYEFLSSTFTESTYSPYALSKVLSGILGREIKPQMMYLYTKKGYIGSSVVGGKILVTSEDAIEWAEKYITKNDPEFVTSLEVVEVESE